MVRDTSIITYNDLRAKGKIGEGQQKVFNALLKLENATDQEIAAHLGFKDPNKARPRRFELWDMGLLDEAEKRYCRVSGRLAQTWEIRAEGATNKPKINCLKDSDMEKVYQLIKKANEFQKFKIRDFIDGKLVTQ